MKWTVWLIALWMAAGLTGCAQAPDESTGEAELEVICSVYPIADVAQRLGGRFVDVTTLLDPGQEPHGLQLKPAQGRRLRRADLLIRVGMGLDAWAARSAPGQLPVLTLAEHVTFSPEIQRELGDATEQPAAHDEGHGPEDEHGDHGPADPHGAAEEHAGHGAGEVHRHERDPHIWLDPVAMQSIARAITRQFIEMDPQHRSEYEANLQQVLQELDQLHERYREALDEVDRRQLVTYHEAFTYIAARYGLEHRALVDVTGGGGLTAGRLREVSAFLRDQDVKTIFVEPQFPVERIKRVAREAGVEEILELDPLGNPTVNGYDGYFAMMQSNLQAITDGLTD